MGCLLVVTVRCVASPAETEPGQKQDEAVSVSSPLFALDDVQCVGTETSLADCSHSAWFSHNCIDTELAAVTCVTVSYPTPPREFLLHPLRFLLMLLW